MLLSATYTGHVLKSEIKALFSYEKFENKKPKVKTELFTIFLSESFSESVLAGASGVTRALIVGGGAVYSYIRVLAD